MRTVFKILYFGALISVLNIGYSSVGFADDETLNLKAFDTTSAQNRIPEHTGDGADNETVNLKAFDSTSAPNRIPEHTDDYIEYMGDGWYYVQSQGTNGGWIYMPPPSEKETHDWTFDDSQENSFDN